MSQAPSLGLRRDQRPESTQILSSQLSGKTGTAYVIKRPNTLLFRVVCQTIKRNKGMINITFRP